MIKRYILFAGVNGSGKTTLYQANPQIQDMPRVNPDEIVRSWHHRLDTTLQYAMVKQGDMKMAHRKYMG